MISIKLAGKHRSKSQCDGLLDTKVVTERQTTSNISANAEATGHVHVVGGLEKKNTNTQLFIFFVHWVIQLF